MVSSFFMCLSRRILEAKPDNPQVKKEESSVGWEARVRVNRMLGYPLCVSGGG